ncbi:mitochondrial folate transporter/carrier-like [Gadus macrocephalus]|uniref:mitochondrial folate transporter/carrier-like n=1 Tax=Gadus chalcogrammus TaxID=1042646 RepID=UPI0024C4E055|nr:mitochondrial folate transporter/carrier-like [Gadus chalcogrammus]XP_059920783.1 mitochondrial folate transporter/carrier-like [Gadus macrocephalus]
MTSSPTDGSVSVKTESPSSFKSYSITGNIQQLLRHVKVENLVAGLSGGVVSTMVLHPLDLVKIRFAVSDGLDLRPKYNGIIHCMRSVWQQEGLRGLYQGATPNIWGAGASWGLYFFFYNAIKAYTKEGRQTELSATEHLVSAAEAGILTLTITNPIWVTKTRLILQYNSDPSSKQYKGMVDALIKIYQQEGVRGLYRGYIPGLFGTSHGALQFMAYEELKRDYTKYKNMAPEQKLNPLEYITMAALSKIFAVATTYPYQVVRARLQDQHNKYNGVTDVIRRTWRNEGARGFYKGIGPNVIRVTPACCITFVVYENVSRLLLGQYK